MKRNGTCPICFIKRLFIRPSKVSELYDGKPYEGGAALTPPMGWSSWNTFANQINEDLIYETAVAMRDKGLVDAGYRYVNIDDNWTCNNRDEKGNLQADPLTFKGGMPALIQKINALGEKVGLYSSNGTATCEDLPASLYREQADAYTLAKWGVEYFKYDFCHNIPLSSYAPLVYAISVNKKGADATTYFCEKAKLFGNARLMKDDKVEGGKHVSGLDRREGAMSFENVAAPEDGVYTLTVHIKKKGKYEKCLLIEVNGTDGRYLEFPSQKHYNNTAKFSIEVRLKKGDNVVKMFNPIATRADSAMLQYKYMGRQLIRAAERVAAESGAPVKPIAFSICEWGRNQPYKWGATAGNLWRTTPDIKAFWPWIMIIYNHNVKLFEHACVGGWNDPDMLEVGNGKLTEFENRAHFALWCMMCAPLILGNDLRSITPEVLNIVTNKKLIAINQDVLGKQAKRVVKGGVDVLLKPLSDGSAAVCVFNKSNRDRTYKLKISTLLSDGYGKLQAKGKYVFEDAWTGSLTEAENCIEVKLRPHDAAVYIVK